MINAGQIETLKLDFCLGHSEVIGNDRVDTLAGQPQIDTYVAIAKTHNVTHIHTHIL